jgi:phage terminase Nu1 subunit (DNA packaging protein)
VTTGSFSEYAAHIGASAPYVSKLKKQGRLVTREEGGKTIVDFELSDRLIRNTTDLGRAKNGSNAQPGRAASAPIAPLADVGRVDAIFRQAQAQERAFNAKLAELEYKKAIGELVSAADVRSVHSKRVASLREAILQIPARLAAVLAAESDQAKCHDVLQAELHAVLQQVTEA